MAEKPVPEVWVGEDIVVLVGEGLEPLSGPLLEVTDRGVVIDHLLNRKELEERDTRGEGREEVRQEITYEDMFIPWHRISGISRSRM